ncbi:MAG: DedA family protein [Candidatus Magasanikbacteria bacterium]|nr:DedA family protein [Candidatus Magasanikbacteria bacterium]
MDYLLVLLPKIQNLGVWIYWIILLVSLLESLAFVGLFVPGTTALIFAGFMASQGIIDIGDLIWFAAIGGVLGDAASFYIGKHSAERIKTSRLFKPEYEAKGEAFFHRYGDFSVILARFVGPLRPVVPFVAGMVKMRYKKFLVFNIIGAFAAATAYLLIGYFFGEAWGRVGPIIEHAKVGLLILAGAGLVGYIFKKKLFKQ